MKYIESLPKSQADTYSSLEIIRMLALIAHKDSSRVTRFIETRLNNYEQKVGHDSKNLLQLYDNQVLAAYLYAKILDLRSSGVKCELNISGFRYTVSKIKVSDLLAALDIIFDEALSTVEKEKSEVEVIVRKDLDGNLNTIIDIANVNELVTTEDMKRMISEEYSLKTKTVMGLRKLSVLVVENDLCLKSKFVKMRDGRIRLWFSLEV